MKKGTLRKIQAPVVAVLSVAFLLTGCTIRRISDMESESRGDDQFAAWTKSGNEFDPVAFVDSIWDDRVLPAYGEQANDLQTVLDAIRTNTDTAIERYGRPMTSGATIGAFKTIGTGVVVEYDDSSRNGKLIVDLVPDGDRIEVQIGPVIRKTAIRDTLEFVSFTEIGNQLQFASLSDELNRRMIREAVDPLDLDSLTGTTITFYGAFTIEDGETAEDVVITPVTIQVSEED